MVLFLFFGGLQSSLVFEYVQTFVLRYLVQTDNCDEASRRDDPERAYYYASRFQMYFHAADLCAQTQRTTAAAVVAMDTYDTLVLPRNNAVPVTCIPKSWDYVDQV